MAIVGITMGYRGGKDVPVLKSAPRVSEAKTSISSSTASSGIALADEYIRVATDTAIWAKFGSDPTAASGDDYFIPAGGELIVEAAAGDKVAVIAA